MQIELSTDEIKEMLSVIEERVGELAEEIHHADTSQYREELKQRRAKLETIQKRLTETLPFASKQP